MEDFCGWGVGKILEDFIAVMYGILWTGSFILWQCKMRLAWIVLFGR